MISAYPKISIIIPVLNAGNSIGAALESIHSQDYGDYEVLILDGRSSDDTMNVVNAYKTRNVRFQSFVEKDCGIYDAMNKGIGKAKGEWLFFLGADDTLYDSQVFRNVMEAAGKVPRTKLLYGNVKLSRPMGAFHEGLIYAGEFNPVKLLSKNICHQAIFYHRSLFRQFGLYHTEYRVFADYDFNLRCFGKTNPVHIDLVVANFNLGGHSSTRQNQDTLFQEHFLENMAVNYSYRFSDPYFTGRKKELFHILIKNLKGMHLRRAAKLLRILTYRTLRSRRDKRPVSLAKDSSVTL